MKIEPRENRPGLSVPSRTPKAMLQCQSDHLIRSRCHFHPTQQIHASKANLHFGQTLLVLTPGVLSRNLLGWPSHGKYRTCKLRPILQVPLHDQHENKKFWGPLLNLSPCKPLERLLNITANVLVSDKFWCQKICKFWLELEEEKWNTVRKNT